MATIYEIKQEILNCIDTETGEILDCEKLEQLNIAHDEKLDNVCCWYKELNADIFAIENEIQSLKERKGKKIKLAENLENYLLTATNAQKFESVRNKVSWIRSEPVEITSETLIPMMFFNVQTKKVINKSLISRVLKTGTPVDGARLKVKMNLQIK